MRPNITNIIQEINSFISEEDTNIELKCVNLIEGSINILNTLNEKFDPQVADELTKKFISSIKNKDSSKFMKKIRSIKIEKPEHHTHDETYIPDIHPEKTIPMIKKGK